MKQNVRDRIEIIDKNIDELRKCKIKGVKDYIMFEMLLNIVEIIKLILEDKE